MTKKKQKSQVVSFFDKESGDEAPHDLLQIINQWDISSAGSARSGRPPTNKNYLIWMLLQGANQE